MERPIVEIHKTKRNGKWEIIISGIPSGINIGAIDEDNFIIRAYFDAERFDPIIRIR